MAMKKRRLEGKQDGRLSYRRSGTPFREPSLQQCHQTQKLKRLHLVTETA